MAKKKAEWKVLASEQRSDENFKTEISAIKSPDGKTEGLSIRTSKEVTPTFTKSYGKSWMPKRIVITDWIEWFISNIKNVIFRAWGRDVEITPEKVEEYKKQVEDLTQKLLKANQRASDAEAQLIEKTKQLELAKQVADKLEDYEQNLNTFVNLITNIVNTDSRDEKSIKDLIKSNKWFLGLDCEVKAAEKEIDPQLSIDLHVKTDLGQDKIFEFKSPNLKPFYKKDNKGHLLLTKDFADAIHQIILYMRRTNIYSSLNEEGTHKIQGPVGIIVIGYNLEDSEIKLLKEWEFHLRPHIRLITYNDLIDTAKMQLENIRYARKGKEENNVKSKSV